jgi:pimeloyl-ACP methyl ester carboxylesterase
MARHEEQVEFQTSDRVTIRGTFLSPENPRRAALLLHGITLNREEFGLYRDLAEELAERGIATLRFDFRGHGESAGSTLDISVIGECLDIRAAIAFLRGLTPAPIQAVAMSFSAGPAIFVAADTPFEKLALIAPVLSYERTFLRPSTPWGERWFGSQAVEASYSEGYSLLENSRLSVRLFEEFRTLSPACVLRQLSLPRLAIHGNRDSMVPFDVTEELLAEIPGARLAVLEGADHGFQASGDNRGSAAKSLVNKSAIIRWIADFLQ